MVTTCLIAVHTVFLWHVISATTTHEKFKANIPRGEPLQKADPTINDLPPAVLSTLDALREDNTLSTILNVATESKEIFGQLILYMTLNWESTGCDWLNDVTGSVENGWQYSSIGGKAGVIKDSRSVFNDVSQTFDPLFVSHWDFSGMPRGLFEELQFLLYTKKDFAVARLKYNLWKINGIEWNHAFVEQLGFQSDDEMQDVMVSSLNKLYSNHKVFDGVDCQLLSPVDLINPIYVHTLPVIAPVWDPLSSSFADTAIAVQFGAKTCSNVRCIGGGFGFSVDGLGNAALFQFMGGNVAIDNAADVQSEVLSTFTVSVGVYEPKDAVTGTVHKFYVDGSDVALVSSLSSEKVIGAEFVYSWDLNTEQLMRSRMDDLATFDVEEVAQLSSSRIAALSVNANYDEMMKGIRYQYRRLKPPSDRKSNINNPDANNLYDESSDYQDKRVRKNDNEDQTLSADSKVNIAKHHEYLWIILSVVGVTVIASAVCYVVKEYRQNNSKAMEHTNYNSDEYQSLL